MRSLRELQSAFADAQGRDGRECQDLHGKKRVGSHATKLVERPLKRQDLCAQDGHRPLRGDPSHGERHLGPDGPVACHDHAAS